LPPFEAIATPTPDARRPKIRADFKASITEIVIKRSSTIGTEGSFIGEDVNVLEYDTMIAGFPNQSFSSAADLNRIVGDIISMNPANRSETQEILDDEEIMAALERADRQYKEGKAKSLRSLMKDLGFEEDALLG
jgi:hypothetical protein